MHWIDQLRTRRSSISRFISVTLSNSCAQPGKTIRGSRSHEGCGRTARQRGWPFHPRQWPGRPKKDAASGDMEPHPSEAAGTVRLSLDSPKGQLRGPLLGDDTIVPVRQQTGATVREPAAAQRLRSPCAGMASRRGSDELSTPRRSAQPGEPHVRERNRGEEKEAGVSDRTGPSGAGTT
jgi:hypothetical protein